MTLHDQKSLAIYSQYFLLESKSKIEPSCHFKSNVAKDDTNSIITTVLYIYCHRFQV